MASSTTRSAEGSPEPGRGTQTRVHSCSPVPSTVPAAPGFFGLAGSAGQAHGGARHLAAGRAQEGGDRGQPAGALHRPLQGLAGVHPEELGGHPVVHEDPPLAVDRHHSRGDVLDHPLDHLLLPHQPLPPLGDVARHLVDRLDQGRQLELGGGEVERRRPEGDPPGPQDELGEGAGEVPRQAGPHRHREDEEGGGDEEGPAAQVEELGRRLRLLGEEGDREEEALLVLHHPRYFQRRVELQVVGTAGVVGARGEVVAQERQAGVDLPRDPLREQAGGEQLVPRGGADRRAPVEVDLVVDHLGERAEDGVVERGVDPEARGEREEAIAELLLRRVERRLPSGPLLALQPLPHGADEDGVQEQEGEEEERGVDEEQTLRVGADGPPQEVPKGGPGERQEEGEDAHQGEEEEHGERGGGGPFEGVERGFERQVEDPPTGGGAEGVGAGRAGGGAHPGRAGAGAGGEGGLEGRRLLPRREGGVAIRGIEGVEDRPGQLVEGARHRLALQEADLDLPQVAPVRHLEAGTGQQPVARPRPGDAGVGEDRPALDERPPPEGRPERGETDLAFVDRPVAGQGHPEGKGGGGPGQGLDDESGEGMPAGERRAPPEGEGEVLALQPLGGARHEVF